MKNTQNNKTENDTKHYKLSDFDLERPEVIREPMKVVPKYGGRLKMFKTSVSLPGFIIDDLRRLARIRGMTSYQALLRERLRCTTMPPQGLRGTIAPLGLRSFQGQHSLM